ncbi:short chain dehydrogenase/reductase [Leptospira ryugenii]|uniref:Short chain dehydrogenase/reductase n=1 Tax=Leptospira ryugenii TaxID=1917863 RepID=A0A2P2E246_9LEPT|nr:SDR family oxidoreductase [Leptospira ryugenii]GBF50929.1 short chain dehydrogenase/reductase [Leptospira ryugenii]
MGQLNGKVAVVTGGNSGIGYATAKALKEAGAKVYITGRDEAKVKKAAEDLGVQGITADVTDLASLDRMVATLQSQEKGIDVLTVNAGVFFGAPIGNNSEQLFDQVVGANFKGAVFTIEKTVPLLREGGSVINISTAMAEEVGVANSAIYAASKAALNAYSRVAMTEFAPKKIRVNVVSPGPVSTPIFGKTGMSEEQIQGTADHLANKNPLKRFGKPEEIAKLVTFLASDESAYINGANITIDGGWHINSGN